MLELSDTNNPLLKQLAFQAPGTFQHSLQVANLAEAAISRIGGNALLTRTGALYHDIGKMELARYFIENQVTSVNPHDELDFEESARLIVSHVKHGIQLARKNALPEKIIDFIRTHHGTSRVQYFYRSFLRNYRDWYSRLVFAQYFRQQIDKDTFAVATNSGINRKSLVHIFSNKK